MHTCIYAYIYILTNFRWVNSARHKLIFDEFLYLSFRRDDCFPFARLANRSRFDCLQEKCLRSSYVFVRVSKLFPVHKPVLPLFVIFFFMEEVQKTSLSIRQHLLLIRHYSLSSPLNFHCYSPFYYLSYFILLFVCYKRSLLMVVFYAHLNCFT